MYVRVDPQRINNIWWIPFEFYLNFRYNIRHFVLLKCLVYIYLPRTGTMQILIVFACWVVFLWENIGVYESYSFPAAGYYATLPKGVPSRWKWVPFVWKILHLLHCANNLQQALLNYHLIKVVFVDPLEYLYIHYLCSCLWEKQPPTLWYLQTFFRCSNVNTFWSKRKSSFHFQHITGSEMKSITRHN